MVFHVLNRSFIVRKFLILSTELRRSIGLNKEMKKCAFRVLALRYSLQGNFALRVVYILNRPYHGFRRHFDE